MMKYNLSQIMKAAWTEFKSLKNYPLTDSRRNRTFGDCLRSAWFVAKQAVKKAAELVSLAGKKFTQDMEITINYVTYSLRRWTNYGKDRIYVTGGKNRSGAFVDLLGNYNNLRGSDADRLASIIRNLAY